MAAAAAGTAVGIIMPMTVEAVYAYFGIVLAGCAVVGIADSFAPSQIAERLRIARAQAVITQDVILRGGKSLPMYARVAEAKAPRAVVIPAGRQLQVHAPQPSASCFWASWMRHPLTRGMLPMEILPPRE